MKDMQMCIRTHILGCSVGGREHKMQQYVVQNDNGKITGQSYWTRTLTRVKSSATTIPHSPTKKGYACTAMGIIDFVEENTAKEEAESEHILSESTYPNIELARVEPFWYSGDVEEEANAKSSHQLQHLIGEHIHFCLRHDCHP